MIKSTEDIKINGNKVRKVIENREKTHNSTEELME